MKNRKLVLMVVLMVSMFLMLVCNTAFAMPSDEQTITDMAGRTVTIPSTIDSVCATGQPGAVLLYTLVPDKLIAWNSELDENGSAYFAEEYLALPVIGSMQGGNTSVNPEAVLALQPDIIVYMTTLTKNTAAKADEIQAQMQTPVVTVSFDMISIGDSYRFLGTILGCAEQAEVLAEFCDTLLTDIQAKVETIPADEQLTFYYTSGGNGLQTSPSGTNHTEIFELVGAVNVVDLEAESNGRLKVDMERILAWSPDVIITSTPAIYASVAKWASVDAVTAGTFYTAPTVPFSWLDAPVSINRIIGLCWAAETLYPTVYEYDLSAYVQTFYELFYHYTLTPEEIEVMLN